MIAPLLWTLSLGLLATVKSKSIPSCPHDFVLIGKKCYFFSPDRQTWQDAYWKCMSLNTTLAIVNKVEQDDLLRNYLNKHKLGKANNCKWHICKFVSHIEGEYERWIGGIYDWKQLKWKWGVSDKPMKYLGFPRSKREEQNLQWHCITTDPLIQNRYGVSNKMFLLRAMSHYVIHVKIWWKLKTFTTHCMFQSLTWYNGFHTSQ